MPRGLPRLRETRVRAHNGQMATTSGTHRYFAPGKVSIRKQMRSEVRGLVTDPANLAVVLCRCDVTNQPVEFTVAFGRPFGDKTRQVTHCPK